MACRYVLLFSAISGLLFILSKDVRQWDFYFMKRFYQNPKTKHFRRYVSTHAITTTYLFRWSKVPVYFQFLLDRSSDLLVVFFAIRGPLLQPPPETRGYPSVVFSRDHQLNKLSEMLDFAWGTPRSLGWVCPRSAWGSQASHKTGPQQLPFFWVPACLN